MADSGRGQVVSWYICTVIPVVFLALRLYSRCKRFGRLMLDDGFLVLAACCLVGDLAIQQHMWNLGMANLAAVNRDQLIGIMKMIVPGSILYITSLWAIKVALVLFYKTLAAPGMKIQIAYNIALVGLAITWGIIFFDIIFQCFPHDKRWSTNPDYQCSSRASRINYWMTILMNIVSDVIIICLPISMVMRLQMKLKQKLGVAAIFALGAFVVVSSIIRAIYSWRNQTMLTCTVSMIETAVAIIAACLPALRTMLLGHTSQAGSSNYNNRYELSAKQRRSRPSYAVTDITNTNARVSPKGSNEELVADAKSFGSGPSSLLEASSGAGASIVNTTVEVHHKDRAESSMTAQNSFELRAN